MTVVILGAGPCGMGAAWRLDELGQEDFIVVEGSGQAGGLASSYTDENGFVWDIGGHVQFSHYEDFDRVMDTVLPDGWLEHQRRAAVWVEGRFVPYPFQYNLWRLEAETVQACMDGLVEIQASTDTAQPAHFGEWIHKDFGRGIADVFMRPYNFKVWAHPLEKLSYGWIGDRVAQVDIERLHRNAESQLDDVAWGPNATFRFPKEDGTGAIWRSAARHIGESKFRLNSRVIGLDLNAHTLHLSDGSEMVYDQLLSTIPLTRLAHAAGIEVGGKLSSSDVHVVGIGLRGTPKSELRDMCWMYFPEDDCPFYRATVFSNYSPRNVPDPTRNWSLMCETSSSAYKPVAASEIVEMTIKGLLATGLIESADDIISTWHHLAAPGYPTPTLDRDSIVDPLLAEFARYDVHSRGRFGAWKYEISNQDHTFMQGFEWADRLLGGEEEETITDPAGINGSGKRTMRKRPSGGRAEAD